MLYELGQKIKRIRELGDKFVKRGKAVASKFLGKDISRLSTEAKLMAKFASMVYGTRANVDAYIFHKELSNPKRGVWINEQLKRLVIAERGTDPKNKGGLEDIAHDALIVIGKPEMIDRNKTELKFVEKMHEQYPDYTIFLSGHSLGASVIYEVLRLLSDVSYIGSAYAFNAGIGKPEQHPNFKKVNNMHIAGDPISAMSRFLKTRVNDTYKQKEGTANPHTIDNFI